MVKPRKIISFLKEKTSKKISTIKQKIGTRFKTIKTEFEEKYNKAKTQPISKRNSALLGFATVLSIFGVVIFTPRLAAFAKDLPKKGNGSGPSSSPSPKGKPGQVAPAPKPNAPHGGIITPPKTVQALSGAAASICAVAVGYGSFLVGVVCGAIVAGGILYAQRHL